MTRQRTWLRCNSGRWNRGSPESIRSRRDPTGIRIVRPLDSAGSKAKSKRTVDTGAAMPGQRGEFLVDQGGGDPQAREPRPFAAQGPQFLGVSGVGDSRRRLVEGRPQAAARCRDGPGDTDVDEVGAAVAALGRGDAHLERRDEVAHREVVCGDAAQFVIAAAQVVQGRCGDRAAEQSGGGVEQVGGVPGSGDQVIRWLRSGVGTMVGSPLRAHCQPMAVGGFQHERTAVATAAEARVGPREGFAGYRGAWAPVMWAARSSGRTNDGGGGGPQENRPLAPSSSSGVQS